LTHQVRYPFLWSFSINPQSFGIKKVKAILPTADKRSFIFAMDGVDTDNKSAGCLEQFLKPEYVRTCGPTFAKLDYEIELEHPNAPLVIGVGVSLNGDNNTLRPPLNVYINGVLNRIEKLV
jgi:hypothetical protein